MKKGIIGKKIGMTQIFDEKGNVIPVTLIEAGPCVVAQKKTAEHDGYDAVQLGFSDVKEKHITKAEKGHFEKAGVSFKRHLKEFRLDDCSAYNVGDVITADTFAAGEKVDITGLTKGRGYTGCVKRWGHHILKGSGRKGERLCVGQDLLCCGRRRRRKQADKGAKPGSENNLRGRASCYVGKIRLTKPQIVEDAIIYTPCEKVGTAVHQSGVRGICNKAKLNKDGRHICLS